MRPSLSIPRFRAGRSLAVFAHLPRWGFVRVYAQGDIGFEWARFTDIPTKCDAICAGDFDGDGFDDLACRDDATGSTAVFWGGEGGLDAMRVSSTPPLPSGELLGPEQKAGLKSELEEECPPPRLMDAVRLGGRTCFTLSTGKTLIFYAADVSRAFSRLLELDAPMAMAAATGDFNGDGHDDIAIAARAPWEQSSQYSPRPQAATPLLEGGKQKGSTSQSSWIWLGSLDGFTAEHRIAIPTKSACSVDALDNMVLFGQNATDGFFTNDALLFTFRPDGSFDPEGFLPTRTTKLPTRGPHGMSAVEPGNILTRGPEEFWNSEPHRMDAGAVVDRIDVTADCPPKTWVKATARAAATRDELEIAEWCDPAGLEIPADGWLQIRLSLGATNAVSSPRVSRVETHFRLKKFNL